LAEATQLWRARSWVSSIILNPPRKPDSGAGILYRERAACTRDSPGAGRKNSMPVSNLSEMLW
jgi:hypothetical protein